METKYNERASKVGKIMTNPRSKSAVLSETAKSRIEEKFIEDNFGVSPTFWSKETNKGNECEIESMIFYVKNKDLFGATKNETKFFDENFNGTPDMIFNGVVYEFKTSWSLFTFPLFEESIPTKDYEYQLQTYLHLTGLTAGKLVYVLTDATEGMIDDEIYRRCMREKIYDKGPEYAAIKEKQIEESVRKEMTFKQVPDELRIKEYDVTYDPEMINEIKSRLIDCGAYYDSLKTKINNLVKN